MHDLPLLLIISLLALASLSPTLQLVISAVRNGAGAGGAMMPLASDLVWLQKDVVLNPSYKNMGLYGR